MKTKIFEKIAHSSKGWEKFCQPPQQDDDWDSQLEFPILTLISTSDNDLKSANIQKDFNSYEFGSIASIQQAQQGHNSKCQEKWNKRVAESIAEIVDESNADNDYWFDQGDLRPKLFDAISGTWLLVDTGASLSVWPNSNFVSTYII